MRLVVQVFGGGSPDAHVASVLAGSADLASDYAKPSPAVLARVRTQHADRLEVKALETSDPEAASQLWAKADRDLTDQAPWVAFANGFVLEVKSARVGDYQVNPQLSTLLGQIWVR